LVVSNKLLGLRNDLGGILSEALESVFKGNLVGLDLESLGSLGLEASKYDLTVGSEDLSISEKSGVILVLDVSIDFLSILHKLRYRCN